MARDRKVLRIIKSFLVIHAASRGRRDTRAGRLKRRCATPILMPASS
ncbi:hypothetical protein C7S13_1830 [Burkholderia cepacia]|nr:hypothetical protein [Burkholderia cepacia]